MPACVEPFQDSTAARAELAPFLERSFVGEGYCTTQQWQRRMAHWWDENPFANHHACRGWLLRHEGRLVGYLGVIPTCYEDGGGSLIPTLIATSWAVDQEHRNSAFPMGLLFQRQGQNALLVDTTPSPEVQKMLQRWGWKAEVNLQRDYLLRGPLRFSKRPRASSALAPGLRIIFDPSLVKSIRLAETSGRLQKHITPAYLQWYAKSPMREHHFVGIIDTTGQLSSYVMLTPQPVKGLPTWAVVDWFTTHAQPQELHALASAITHSFCGLRGHWWPFLTLPSFGLDNPWQGLPKVHRRSVNVCHFHSLPASLKDRAKRSVLAEGDWGL